MPALKLFAVLALLVSFGADAAEPITLAEATRSALERNPALVAVRAEVAVARAKLDGASLLLQTNPELTAAIGARVSPRAPSLELDLGLEQRLEVFGQRGARKDSAQATLSASEARRDGLQLAVTADVREAFGRALAAEQLLRLSEAGRALCLSSLKAAEERFAAGGATRIEVNTARVEIGRAARELALAQQHQVQSHGALALLAGLRPEALVLAGTVKPAADRSADEPALVARALAQRPDLRAARAELEAARADQRLAAREWLPSPRLGIRYGKEEDAHLVQGTIGFELPVFNQHQAARGVAAGRLLQAEQAVSSLSLQIEVEVAMALSRYRAASVAAEAYAGEVLKAMEENTELVTAAYQAGKVDFLQLLLIQRQTLEARRGHIETLEELNAAEARLLRVVGSVPAR
ncbi:MAG: outer rane efflux protein [Myxococcaceae bacterium]|nr:outer rane efflux protein [Myxococcaceae bacterium]